MKTSRDYFNNGTPEWFNFWSFFGEDFYLHYGKAKKSTLATYTLLLASTNDVAERFYTDRVQNNEYCTYIKASDLVTSGSRRSTLVDKFDKNWTRKSALRIGEVQSTVATGLNLP